ncbi:hypothetical protein MA16_Dca027239 [Dendrobium catenatum]|uniref:Uncharacterized protein n=1 Tax=Dendrobium catenatum TaxID=906689 RepID=A0A2I0VTP1_9ASPA|nr:hypothetical protein MA16_Dca027239 [Dendrobium catenatum]
MEFIFYDLLFWWCYMVTYQAIRDLIGAIVVGPHFTRIHHAREFKKHSGDLRENAGAINTAYFEGDAIRGEVFNIDFVVAADFELGDVVRSISFLVAIKRLLHVTNEVWVSKLLAWKIFMNQPLSAEMVALEMMRSRSLNA